MKLAFGKVGSVGTIAGVGAGRLVSAALFFGVSMTAVVIGVTGAVFTDTENVGANTFTAGTVDISTSPGSAVVTFPTMAPGDESVGELTVTNAGSLELRYDVTATTSENTFAANLDMTIKTGVTTCTSGGFGTDGSVVYGAADLGSTSGIEVISNRVLAGGASEELCIKVALPIGIGNAAQGLTTTASFNFAAEQTANN